MKFDVNSQIFRLMVLNRLDEKYKEIFDEDAKLEAYMKLLEVAHDVPGLDDEIFDKIKMAVNSCAEHKNECRIDYWSFREGVAAVLETAGEYTIDRNGDGEHQVCRRDELKALN